MADEWGQPNEEDFGWDSTDQDVDDIRSRAQGTVDKPGWYQFEISNVELKLSPVNEKSGKENTPHILFTCTVANTVKGQSPVGSKFFHRLYVGGKGGTEAAQYCKDQAVLFGSIPSIGVFEVRDVNGKRVAVDVVSKLPKVLPSAFQRAKCKYFMGKLGMGRATDQYEAKLEMREVADPRDESVADVPKDWELLEAAGIRRPAAGAAAASTGTKAGGAKAAPKKDEKPKPQPKQEPSKPAPPAADDDFDLDSANV